MYIGIYISIKINEYIYIHIYTYIYVYISATAIRIRAKFLSFHQNSGSALTLNLEWRANSATDRQHIAREEQDT